MSVLILTCQDTSRSIKFQIRKRRLCTFIRSFGNDGEVNLTIKGGKISVRVEYVENLQSFSGILDTDGKWHGKFIKQIGKEKVTFLIRRGKISRGRMSEVSKALQGGSDILFEGGKRRKSKREDSQFRIRLTLSPKLEVSGIISHKSTRHYTSIELIPAGRWNAKGWIKLTGGRFLFSAEMGKCQTRFEGKPRFVSRRSDVKKS